MSLASRQEHLDDLLQDSNFKKMTGGDQSLLRKYHQAQIEEKDTRTSYEDLKDRLPLADIEKWDQAGKEAVASRDPALLRIFELEGVEGKGFAEVRTNLWTIDDKSSDGRGVVELELLTEALSLEGEQRDLRHFIRSKGRGLTQTEIYQIEDKRVQLEEKCSKYHKKAFQQMFLGIEGDPPELVDIEREYHIAVQKLNLEGALTGDGKKRKHSTLSINDETEDEYYDEDAFIDGWWESGAQGNRRGETITLALPSSLSVFDRNRVGWVEAAEKERELRKGRINDILSDLRLLLGEKIMQYLNLRHDQSQKNQKRGYNGLHALQKKILGTQEEYRRQVRALIRLGDKTIWPDITKQDLGVRSENQEQDRLGKPSRDLAWFWRYGDDITREVDSKPAMEKFYRVNYLKAQAEWQRWDEELLLLKKEAIWRVAWFTYHKELWETRAKSTECGSGLQVHAHQMSLRWEKFALRSEKRLREGGLLS
ncbi:hypothetical protein VKT23_009905 [Stygiomarasmius scandens]|uniref:Uncharacterized protein n=1 Tax=Marasmiellus scandens TaxID=2682957 RepID=A0ABR1JIB7_9AGAR